MKYIILLCVFIGLTDELHSQVRSVQFSLIEKKVMGGFWEHKEVTITIPNAFIDGKTQVENNINEFIEDIYAEEENGWRYTIDEFKSENISPYLCKLFLSMNTLLTLHQVYGHFLKFIILICGMVRT
ncbi:MAG: hypothetical protein ABI315_09055 [Bacteroidia bacterium]